MLNVFSGRDCFFIDDEKQEYYPTVDGLAAEIKNLQIKYDADTESVLKLLLDSYDLRIIEAYKRSIPYVIQSASFVNSISDSETLVLVSAVIGYIHKGKNTNINDIEAALISKFFPPEQLNRKSILTSVINLEKSGVLTKTDDGYCLSGSLKDVVGYVRLI
jgi:hypothetical protein